MAAMISRIFKDCNKITGTHSTTQKLMENEEQQWILVFIYFEVLILYDYSRFYHLKILVFII
jgi:hypothetical protein